jgi:polyhydroxyalkanoate synthesis regulator phasin
MYKVPTPISYVYTARNYVNSLLQAPGKTEQQLVKNAEVKVDDVIKTIDTFFKEDWNAYRKRIEALNLNLFKDYKALK